MDGELSCYACGERHDSAIAKHLPDGTIVGLQSNAYALYCEAKTVLRWPIKKRREYLERVEKARGMAGRRKLEDEIRRWHRPVAKTGAAVHPAKDR